MNKFPRLATNTLDTVADRLVMLADGENCWEWRWSTNPDGYGEIRIGGKKMRAHRVAYHVAYGEDPGRRHVLHSCDNPPCVNPGHLRLGTHTDNMRDRSSRGRAKNGHSEKTHCKWGHPFDEQNTMQRKGGGRICRTCHREKGRKWKQKQREQLSPDVDVGAVA